MFLRQLVHVPLLGVAIGALTACGGTAGLKGPSDGTPETATAAAMVPASPAKPSDAASAPPGDPLEGFNRAMYTFNDKLDTYVMKPVAKGYRAVLPTAVRRSISNFFSNLHEPVVILNDLLQANGSQAVSDTGRFLSNSTVGVLGLFDVATSFGMPQHDEDFGQTLAVWGVGEGAYLVLPFFGPSSIRDGTGLVADWESYPPNHLNDSGTRDKLWLVNVVDTRAKLLDTTDILEQAGGQDPYVFVREAYRQRRRNLIYNGHPPEEQLDKSLLFEDDEPAPKPEPAPTPSPANPREKGGGAAP